MTIGGRVGSAVLLVLCSGCCTLKPDQTVATPPAAPQPAVEPAGQAQADARPPRPVPATPASTPATPAAPAAAVPVAKPPAATAPLDLTTLKQELTDTKAIGFFSKLTLKNQMDDLLDRLREFHQGTRKTTPVDLRRSYDLLIMKVLSLVQDDDKKLASDILSSREVLWGLLVDPVGFATLDV